VKKLFGTESILTNLLAY